MHIDILDESNEIINICRRYWDVSDEGVFRWTVASIAEEYSISSYEIQKIARKHSIAYSDKLFCCTCDEPYIYKNRQDYNTITINNWTCEYCEEKLKASAEDNKADILNREFERSIENAISLDNISVRHAVFLLALIRYSANEDLSYLNEFDANRTEVFSPDYDYSLQIIRELYRANLIAINPLSNIDAIELKEGGEFSFYLSRVKWLLPLQAEIHPRSFIEQLEEKMASMSFVESSYDDIVDLCKELSLKECVAYLDHVVAEHQLSFTPGDKTTLVLSKALQSFSVAQIYNFIWRSGKDAAAFYLRASTSKKHAANTIVGNIERQIERALANNWDITAFRRNYDMPQSMVSRVLFNTLLHTDDGGFSKVLCKII